MLSLSPVRLVLALYVSARVEEERREGGGEGGGGEGGGAGQRKRLDLKVLCFSFCFLRRVLLPLFLPLSPFSFRPLFEVFAVVALLRLLWLFLR